MILPLSVKKAGIARDSNGLPPVGNVGGKMDRDFIFWSGAAVC